jgi:hypothetical protein
LRLKYLLDNVWTKYEDPLPGEIYFALEERKQSAIAKWQAAEYRNAKTNCRLLTDSVDFGYFTSERLISVAKGFIASVLGTAPPPFLVGEFTGGASTRVSRSECAIPQKFEGRPHSTLDASHWWGGLALAFPLLGDINPELFRCDIVPGSVMFTVPKNSHIERVACKEPEVNMFLQRSLGLFIRKRLKKVGIDLRDQTRNQALVKDGKRRGLATIDLSSASDTISRELVRLLVPADWYHALDSLRAKEVTVPGSEIRHRLEMFSSMGNGFTFELESLLFWALTRGICYLLRVKGKLSVYGDDIICPIPAARLLPRVFAFFGFSVNYQKSCISGDYRESCGKHYHGTVDVTPFFVRKKPRQISDLIQIANQLMSWCRKELNPDDIPTSFGYIWGLLATHVPTSLYGGQSLERTDALVSGHGPRKVLLQKRKRVDVPQPGAYLWWHLGKERGPLRDTSLLPGLSPEYANVCDDSSLILRSWSCPLTYATHTPNDAFQLGKWVTKPNRAWRDESLLYDTMCTITSFFDRVDR